MQGARAQRFLAAETTPSRGFSLVTKTISAQDLLNAQIDPTYFSNVVAYSSPDVKTVRWDEGHGNLTIVFDGSIDELDRLIERIKDKIGRAIVNRKPDVIFSHGSDRAPQKRDVWEEMIRAGMVKDFGDGHVAYSGLFLDLVQRLDSAFQDVAAEIGAEPVHMPNFISLDYMKRMGVFDKYPHHLYFLSPLVPDIEKIEKFQSEEESSDPRIVEYLKDPRYCLKTSACALLYPLLENTAFSRPAHYTMLGCCTRHETKMATSLERLTEFTMREIVFVGDEAGADEFQRFCVTLLQDLIESFDLTARIASASDSFFVSNYGKYRLMQLLGKEKFEAQLVIPDTGADIAVGSFNHHRRFFGQRFGFSYCGEPAASACIGFGLERLAYGIVCQCGMERPNLMKKLDCFLELRAQSGKPGTPRRASESNQVT